MNIIYLIFTSIFFLLFLTTALDKILHFKKHSLLMANYHIITGNFIWPILSIFIIIELFLAYSFLSNNLNTLNAGTAIILLFIYTLAVIINLLKGNTEIDCGCGGVLKNDRLSFGLVIRNLLLILLIALAFIIQDTVTISFHLFTRLWMILFAGGILLAIATLKEYKNPSIVLKFIKRIN